MVVIELHSKYKLKQIISFTQKSCWIIKQENPKTKRHRQKKKKNLQQVRSWKLQGKARKGTASYVDAPMDRLRIRPTLPDLA